MNSFEVDLLINVSEIDGDTEGLKEIIEKHKDYKINAFHIMELAIATKDAEYMKELIEEHEKYGFTVWNIVNLALATNDKEYIKKIIQSVIEKHKNGFIDIAKLAIATSDAEYMKEIIEKYKEYGITAWNIVDIAIATKDVEYMKKIIEKHDEYGFDVKYIVKLAKATNDVEYMKGLIENHNKYGITVGYIVELANTINDTEYMKKVIQQLIERREEYNIDASYIVKLIKRTNDIDYMKEIIQPIIEKHEEYGFSAWNIVELAKATDDIEYMKNIVQQIIEKHEEYDCNATYIVGLAMETKDMAYVKEIIQQITNKHEEYGCDASDLVNLAKVTNDAEYVKKIIQQIIEKHDEYGINATKIVDLAIATKDIDYMRKIIEKYEEYGMTLHDKLTLLVASGELGNYLKENMKIKPAKEISLPGDMTVGIEIESEMGIKQLASVINKGWTQEDDTTLRNGIETKSPILSGKTHSVEEIYNVCAILEATGHVISERCGGHVHIGADYLTSVESYKNLMEIWANSEKILYPISNKTGEVPRSGAEYYAKPISRKMELALETGEVDLNNEMDLTQFVFSLSEIQEDRLSGINFCNILSEEKNTIEFRISNGTIDPDTWVENINLYGGIIKAAQDLSIIQKKGTTEQTEDDANKLRLLEILKYENSSPEDKLEALLGLTIKEEQRDIYRERYRVNSEMLKETPEKEQKIDEQISDRPLKISEVGKAVFTGENAITGEEYRNVEGKMNELLARENEQSRIDS